MKPLKLLNFILKIKLQLLVFNHIQLKTNESVWYQVIQLSENF